MQDTLLIDKYIMDKDIQQGSAYASFLSKKSSRIEDQVYLCVPVCSNCKPPYCETLTKVFFFFLAVEVLHRSVSETSGR